MVFHENEMGYITLMEYNDNFMTIYVYADGGMKPTQDLTNWYDKNPLELANYLYRVFDKNGLWDESIEEHIGVECNGAISLRLLEEDEEW